MLAALPVVAVPPSATSAGSEAAEVTQLQGPGEEPLPELGPTGLAAEPEPDGAEELDGTVEEPDEPEVPPEAEGPELAWDAELCADWSAFAKPGEK